MATKPAFQIDHATAAAIRAALAAAQSGRLEEACSTAQRALAGGGDKIALNALLGALRTGSGEYQAAINHLEIAHAARPSDVRIAFNLATALSKTGELERALGIASQELALADPSLQLARLRAYLADQLRRFDLAIAAYEFVVRSAPDDWASWNNLGNAKLAAGEIVGGIADIERAISIEPDSPPARLNLARAHRRAGNYAQAEQLLRRMADDFPSDAMPLKDLYELLLPQNREHELLELLDRAIERDPGDLGLLLARGVHLGLLLEMEKAEAAFRAVLERDPANEEAYVGLAVVYEHQNPSALGALADEAEGVPVGENALNLLRAFRARRSKQYAEAIEALDRLNPEFETLRQYDLRGQMLEKLGRYDEAFAAFENMNQVQSEDPSQPLARGSAFRSEIRTHLGKTTQEWVDSWQAVPDADGQRSPVFLVGFPRSGTTLLDTILMGHPDVAVLEERPVLLRVEDELGGFDALPSLDEAKLREFRQRYFDIAAEYVPVPEHSLLVDKSPMLLNRAATINRLFPHAKFILALRHPADVLLSCFISNFRLNDAMTSFLRLDTAAELYDLTFRNWENARSLLPLNVHTIVYEQMVDDPRGVLQPLAEWLGLPWHDDMLDHTKTAAGRGLISTASYAQVTEPIYRRSVDRWRNYRKHLERVLPVLEPWIAKFGYTL